MNDGHQCHCANLDLECPACRAEASKAEPDIGKCDWCGDETRPRRQGFMADQGCYAWLCSECRTRLGLLAVFKAAS